MNFGKNIKKFRLLKKLTQDELADLLNTTSKSISRWESDITYPDISMLPNIANIFEITVDELLGVELIKQDDYINSLLKKAYEYQINNDYQSELKLWKEAYKKLPNNDEIKFYLIDIMMTINIMTNELKYTNEIIKISDTILNKSTNTILRLNVTYVLVNLYSQMNNIEMAEFYCKQLPKDYFCTYDVMKTRYLNNRDLLLSIQKNISSFVDEIVRESEFVNNKFNDDYKLSNEYKKEYLERLIKLEEIVFVKDNDYGYNGVSILFNYIELAKLEIKTNDDNDKVNNYLSEINNILIYIINFKPHVIKSPFMNMIKCENIGSYCCIMNELKENILVQLNDKIFDKYKNKAEYTKIIDNLNSLK